MQIFLCALGASWRKSERGKCDCGVELTFWIRLERKRLHWRCEVKLPGCETGSLVLELIREAFELFLGKWRNQVNQWNGSLNFTNLVRYWLNYLHCVNNFDPTSNPFKTQTVSILIKHFGFHSIVSQYTTAIRSTPTPPPSFENFSLSQWIFSEYEKNLFLPTASME